VQPEFFNQLTTLHGLIMIFGAIMPALRSASRTGRSLMIGAPDMAFPRMNNWSFWLLPPAAILLVGSSLFVPGGAVAGGWTMYPPLFMQGGISIRPDHLRRPHHGRQSSIMGSINIITTILNLRAPGMT
jgi:cytochrome c oxidase subunit 1